MNQHEKQYTLRLSHELYQRVKQLGAEGLRTLLRMVVACHRCHGTGIEPPVTPDTAPPAPEKPKAG